LIAAGLRAGGIRTCAKTTGTLPRFIRPDGSEEPVVRIGRANVIEQLEIMDKAVEHRAEALVIECMAVHPLLQSLCELRLVQSTHGIVTNARPDHLDVMGPTPRDVARALSGTTPIEGTLYTAETLHADVFRQAAEDRGSRFVSVDPEGRVSCDELSRFAHLEHPDNVALALRVCTDLGVDRETALEGMWAALPDPGVMTTSEVVEQGRRVTFVNGFAANDPQSTEHNWKLAGRLAPHADTRIAVVNCRADRPDRSVQMAEMVAGWEDLDRVIVIGTGTEVFLHAAEETAVPVIVAEHDSAQQLYERIAAVPGGPVLAMGMGNIAGVGMELVELFHQRRIVLSDRDARRAPTWQEAA
ncbi:MAG: poly-gamma-glutamate synthase PgsB, partial [Planctomycetaceae bacterium]